MKSQRSSFELFPVGSAMKDLTAVTISRRSAIGGSISLLAPNALLAPALAGANTSEYSSAEEAERWMKSWMDELKASSGFLYLGRFHDRMYFLVEEIHWTPVSPSKGPKLTVPRGFVTDLASIPRTFWSIFPPDGAYAQPAVVHDYMYWTQKHSREVADEVFYEGMLDMKVPKAQAKLIHEAVRAGGGSAWNNNSRLRASGHKRLVRTFPQDPRTTWAEWQKQKDCCDFI
jgi:hypothetical protein